MGDCSFGFLRTQIHLLVVGKDFLIAGDRLTGEFVVGHYARDVYHVILTKGLESQIT